MDLIVLWRCATIKQTCTDSGFDRRKYPKTWQSSRLWTASCTCRCSFQSHYFLICPQTGPTYSIALFWRPNRTWWRCMYTTFFCNRWCWLYRKVCKVQLQGRSWKPTSFHFLLHRSCTSLSTQSTCFCEVFGFVAWVSKRQTLFTV